MTDHLKAELANRIAAKKVLVVIGTGVSVASTGGDKLASWKGLIASGVERCIDLDLRKPTWGTSQKELLDAGDLNDLLSVAEQVSGRLGWKPTESCGGDWNSWLRSTVGSLRANHPELIEAIHDLGVPIATLNYDDLLSNVTQLRPITWKRPESWPPVLQGEDQAILHLHGHWHEPSSVVLGIRSYDAVMGKTLAQHLQRALASLQSLVFIGCSGTLEDPNFSSLLTWMREQLSGVEHSHYLLIREGEPLPSAEPLLREARIVPLRYGAHAELRPFIRDLAPKPPNKSGSASNTGGGGDNGSPPTSISHRHIRNATEPKSGRPTHLARSDNESEGQFGNSEGSFEDFSRFLNIKIRGSPNGMGLNPRDLTTRVIVGRRGSGKTFYLRCLEAASRDNEGYYVFEPGALPSTQNVVRFTNLFPDEQRSDLWSTLWRRMIFRSLATLFFAETDRPHGLPSPIPGSISPDVFRNTFRRQIPDYKIPKAILPQVDDVIMNNATDMSTYLFTGDWESIERIVRACLRESPKICMYIDALDEKCRYAPAAWLDCQKGLFYQVMTLLTDHDLANRLHIVISLRDSVRASVMDSEQASKYYSNRHIKLLDWTPDLAREFLRTKVQALPKDFLALSNKRGTKRTCETWLGLATIKNPRRGVEEDVESYILRHTRQVPRDIVNMGNALCDRNYDGSCSEEWIRSTVSAQALFAAHESLRTAACNIAAAFPGADTSDARPLRDIIFESLQSAILTVGKDVFSCSELMAAVSKHRLEINGQLPGPSRYGMHEIQNALWQQGMIGYRETVEGRATDYFNRTGHMFSLPANKDNYIFFPGLIDMVGIVPVGSKPVGEVV